MSMGLSILGKQVGVSFFFFFFFFFRVSPQRPCVYVVVCINLYNFEFTQAFIYACAQLFCFHGITNSTLMGMQVQLLLSV